MGEEEEKAGCSSVSPTPTTTNGSKIPDLDNHLRTIILGLQGASSGPGSPSASFPKGEKPPWTLPPKTKAQLVASAQAQLDATKSGSSSSAASSPSGSSKVKECWTPESNFPPVSLSGSSGSPNLVHNPLAPPYPRPLPPSKPQIPTHSTISILQWPQRNIPWWNGSSGGSSDPNVSGRGELDPSDKYAMGKGREGDRGCGPCDWAPRKKSVALFSLGVLLGGLAVLFIFLPILSALGDEGRACECGPLPASLVATPGPRYIRSLSPSS